MNGFVRRQNGVKIGEDCEKTVIFLHIPKSAGQTLFKILEREYKPSEIYTFQGGRHHLSVSIEKFKELTIDERNSFRLLRGHFSFGIHNLIDWPFTYVTILRDPVSRIVSHFNYVLRTPSHTLHKLVKTREMSLEHYVADGISTELNNGQVRLISGIGSTLPFGHCNEKHLKRAITNLENHFAVVGLTERFDDTILLMQQNLHWNKTPFYTKRNVAKHHFGGLDITSETIDIIRKYNALDCQLYEFAMQQFEKTVMKLPMEMKQRFHKMNSIYYPYGLSVSKVRSWINYWLKNFKI